MRLLNRIVFAVTLLMGAALSSSQARAQSAIPDSVQISMEMFEIRPDTVRASLVVGVPGDSLSQSIRAFQFEWSITSNLEYIGLDNEMGLAAASGWTAAVNPDKGRAGGFSSSLDAMMQGGYLLVMEFQRLKDDQPAEICFNGIRLNSDNPVAEPASICRVISF